MKSSRHAHRALGVDRGALLAEALRHRDRDREHARDREREQHERDHQLDEREAGLRALAAASLVPPRVDGERVADAVVGPRHRHRDVGVGRAASTSSV